MIEARGLSKRFETGALGLDEVSFTVSPGEIFCLLGGAGAGKTTLISLFWAALAPTRGAAFIAGIDVTTCPMDAKRAATIVTATGALHPEWTARQNVTFLVQMAGVRPQVRRPGIENAMRRVGVRERDFDQPVRALAGGASVLLWLAIAAARETRAVLIDDPTLPRSTEALSAVQEGLLQLKREGKAILFATSDAAFATSVADRIGVLRSGRLVAARTRSELLGQNLTQFFVEYMGWPRGTGTTPSGARPA